jgi:hypothetical protein
MLRVRVHVNSIIQPVSILNDLVEDSYLRPSKREPGNITDTPPNKERTHRKK